MKYIAALDYEHLDNGVFLTTLARSISQQQNTQPLIVHADSAYTERVMQNGVMREEAKIRSIKDLNHRLIALFADEGVSAVGLHGFQRNFITQEEGNLTVDGAFFEDLPPGPALIVSTLCWDKNEQTVAPISLARLVSHLRKALEVHTVYAFSSAKNDMISLEKRPDKLYWNKLPEGFSTQNLPVEFTDFDEPLYLTTAGEFHKISTRPLGINIR